MVSVQYKVEVENLKTKLKNKMKYGSLQFGQSMHAGEFFKDNNESQQ